LDLADISFSAASAPQVGLTLEKLVATAAFHTGADGGPRKTGPSLH